jgi:ABC-type transport system involved in multi-copper enzyme maturation permease subunit
MDMMNNPILDYTAIIIAIWFTPHFFMMIGLDEGSYWKSYKASFIAMIFILLGIVIIIAVVLSFWRLLGWI